MTLNGRRFFLIVCIAMMAAVGCLPCFGTAYAGFGCAAQAEDSGNTGFWHTEGANIVDENGDAVALKCMELYGTWWYTDGRYGQAPVWDHDEATYAELRELGFNSVRLLMGWMFFEKEPFDYSNADWVWLDTNIAWAEKNGIKIILTMEKTQGENDFLAGERSLFYNIEAQERLIRLWRVIAERYADCPTIAGWELINEPAVDIFGNMVTQYASVCDLMQKMTDAIREVDPNHMIFCERCTGTSNYDFFYKAVRALNLGPDDRFMYPYVKDDNLVHAFHCHYPAAFTMRYGIWDEYPGYFVFQYVDRNKLREEMLRIQGIFDDVYGSDQYPVFISEFCVKFRSDDIERSQGYLWLSDVMDVFNELGFGYCYDGYHSDTVGLWDAPTWQDYKKGTRDETLAQIFRNKNQ